MPSTATTFAVLSGAELVLVVAIVVIVFGAAWMPKIARKAGQTKVHVDEAKAELAKAKEELSAPVKGAVDLVAKVDKTINAKPKDIVKRLVAPTAPDPTEADSVDIDIQMSTDTAPDSDAGNRSS